MEVLVVSATRQEITPFLEKNILVDYLITGVGSPACCYHLTKSLAKKKYDLVIQAGVAGSFNMDIPLGYTVWVQKDVFADIAAIEADQLVSVFEMGLANKNEWPYTEGWLLNNHPYLQETKLKKVNGITINTITDNLQITNLYKQKYEAEIETMEGAALHFVCLLEKVNFLQLRSISNIVGERDKLKWKMKEAILNLNEELLKVVNAFQ